MQDLQRVQFIAANYSRLQGLKAVPYGMALLLVVLWANLRRGPRSDLLFPAAILLLMLGLAYLVDQYYKNRYGRIQPTPARKRLDGIQAAVGGGAGMLAFLLDNSAVPFPVSFVGLLFAAVFVYEYFLVWHTASAPYLLLYPILAALTLAVSVLPLLGLSGWWQLLGIHVQLFGVLIIVGAEMIIGGLIGHFYLNHLLSAGAQHGRSV